MNHYFEKYAEKGDEFLELLAEELRCPNDIPRAFRVLRCVFHTLRTNVPPEVSLQFIAQLPMVIKALYIAGWKLSDIRKKPLATPDEFIQAVRQVESGSLATHDFNDRKASALSVHAVFQTARRYISDGEWLDMVAAMPASLREFLVKRQPDRFHIL